MAVKHNSKKYPKNNSKSDAVTVTKEKCKRCKTGTMVTDTESGEIVCNSCGFVMSEKLEDFGPEYRRFMDVEGRARAGAGISLSRYDMGLSTVIDAADKDARGKPLSSSMKRTLGRLRIWDSRTQTYKSYGRNFRIAFNELGKLKDKLGLSQATIEKAAYIYRKAVEKNLVRGRSIPSLLGASLYAACRESETPRTLRDIELVSNVKKKELTKCFRIIVEKLDLKMPVVSSVSCISRIANKLGISEKSKRLAVKILKDYEKTGDVAGKSPTGLAATVLYLACVKLGENYSQKEIAKASNITEVTIRNRGAAIKKILNLNNKCYSI